MVLARLRQLSRTWATRSTATQLPASPVNRASVMDYPAPRAKLDAMVYPICRKRIRPASASGTKSPSRTVIRIFPPGTNEPQALDAHCERSRTRTDVSDGSGRASARQREFGGPSLGQRRKRDRRAWQRDEGGPLRCADLAKTTFAKARRWRRSKKCSCRYMYHRYQVEAAAKAIGGQDYTFSLKGKGDRTPRIVAPEEQRRALAAVLDTINRKRLSLPEPLLRIIPPRAHGLSAQSRSFRTRTQPVFDAVAPAEAIADHVSNFLLNGERGASGPISRA